MLFFDHAAGVLASSPEGFAGFGVAKVGSQFIQQAAAGEDVAVTIALSGVPKRLNGLLKGLFVAQRGVGVAANLLGTFFGVGDDATGVPGRLGEERFGSLAKLFRFL